MNEVNWGNQWKNRIDRNVKQKAVLSEKGKWKANPLLCGKSSD